MYYRTVPAFLGCRSPCLFNNVLIFIWQGAWVEKELLDESENIRFGKTVWEATKVVAVFSFMIEFTQLLFHLGTFQISDLTYNTLGGALVRAGNPLF